nr:MAG TPA: hypothetical protein [Caudoviricetes sp.]
MSIYIFPSCFYINLCIHFYHSLYIFNSIFLCFSAFL